MIRRLGLLQIDSVNILVRAHYMPLFSRLGAYDRAALDGMAFRRRAGALFEYWAHEASLLPVEQQPLLRWRMERAARNEGIWQGIASIASERRAYVDAVLAEIAARGPLGASQLSEPGSRSGRWWGRADGKRALEYLFWTGQVTTAARRNFERLYDLPARVLPQAILAAPTPSEADAQRSLTMIAARALGVATAGDLRDYFRLKPADGARAIAALVDTGELAEVTVEGWRHPAYLDPAARVPRRVEAAALLSPFDPLVWERARTERLFGFRYRIEIYTPATKRTHGYYVLPFLWGERLAARVDLKADRAHGTLRVLAAYAEPGLPETTGAAALAAELRRMATWLGLARIAVGRRGDLASGLRRALA